MRRIRLDSLDISNYRYERKFILNKMNQFKAESFIYYNSAMFSEIFQKRKVNNIYFDSLNLNNYNDNIIGNSPRKKIRIRWYGEETSLIKNPMLEFKIKKGLLGKKLIYPLSTFRIGDSNLKTKIIKTLLKSDIPVLVKNELKNQIPIIMNSYKRKYFLSADKRFRLTLDFDQKFFKLKSINSLLKYRYFDKSNVVLELKYSKRYDGESHYITNQFPFRLSKSSKYVIGVEKLFF